MDAFVRIALVICVVMFFGYCALYSRKVLERLFRAREKTGAVYYKVLGRRVRRASVQMERAASLNKKGRLYKMYMFFEDMILNLDMSKDNVTVTGLLIFLVSISFSIGLIVTFVMDSFMLLVPVTLAVLYLLVTVFRLAALTKYEKREAAIMDAVDLLVSDVKGGVYNAVSRYMESFSPLVKPFFFEFVDDIREKGYSFEQAMRGLNAKLGMNFTDFAQKAILYERKADENLDDIFSSIIEMNRQRRTLRYINAQEFAKLRSEFIVCFLMIVGYALFSALLDPNILYFLTHLFIGKVLVVVDIVIVAWVLSYMAAVKAKSL